MLGYRKKSFFKAHAMIAELRANHDNLTTLKKLQQLLYREVIRTERKIRKLKSEREAVLSARSKKTNRRSKIILTRIEKIRYCAYIWRCFGDAIAFLYLDKYALKQCFYAMDRPTVKQKAGFISDKSGFTDEIALLESALDQDTPALLVDLTETIRHGDICLMNGPDPYLIEVKASTKLDRRGRRQKKDLAKLESFLDTDRAESFRGYRDVRRVTASLEERNHIDILDELIDAALRDGHAIRIPEPGLYYLALTERAPDIDEILGPLDIARPWIFQLNEFKATRTWSPYFPFTLSISNKDHLWSFIRGDFYLMIFLAQDTFLEVIKNKGFTPELDLTNEERSLGIIDPSTGQQIFVSSHFIRRIGLEFMSPEWLIDNSIALLRSQTENASLTTKPEDLFGPDSTCEGL